MKGGENVKRTEIKTVPIEELKVAHYQVWSKMPAEQFEAFAKDIKENGISDILHVDEDLTILDGHHRYEAAKIAGFSSVDVKVHYGLTEEEKIGFAHKNNALTREISREEKIKRAIELRKDGRSYPQIAEWLGVSEKTVRRWIKEFPTSACDEVGKIEGRDGKLRPAEKPKKYEIDDRRELIRKAYFEEGKSPKQIIEEIGEKFGVGKSTIYNDIKAIEKAEEEAKKEQEAKKRKQRLGLLELETKLREETAPRLRDDEPRTSPNNMVIYAREKVQQASINITGVFEKVGEADENVRIAYLEQVKSLVESALITLGQYAEDEEEQELIYVCLEVVKKLRKY